MFEYKIFIEIDEKKMKELKEQLDRVIGQYESRVVYMVMI